MCAFLFSLLLLAHKARCNLVYTREHIFLVIICKLIDAEVADICKVRSPLTSKCRVQHYSFTSFLLVQQ